MQGMDPATLQAAQTAALMMTPEQRKAELEKAMRNATPAERKQMEKQQREMQKMWESASPEERAQIAAQQQIARDAGAFCHAMRPDPADYDKMPTTVDVLTAITCCTSFEALHENIKSQEGDEKKKVIMAFINLERWLLENMVAEDVSGLKAFKDAGAEKKRALLLLLWVLYRVKADDAVEIDARMLGYIEGTKRLATKVLMQAQMMLPQQRWIKAVLATSQLSALFVNELWSHAEPDCIERMKESLKQSELNYPVLKLRVRTILEEQAAKEDLAIQELGKSEAWLDSEAAPAQALPKQFVRLQVELTRQHTSEHPTPGDAVTPDNPQGILEAYWLYIEGVKPDGEPNVMIAAQPLVVKDLTTTTLRASVKFESPPQPGEYTLIAHIASTTVIGCDLNGTATFNVVEDDVPPLM